MILTTTNPNVELLPYYHVNKYLSKSTTW